MPTEAVVVPVATAVGSPTIAPTARVTAAVTRAVTLTLRSVETSTAVTATRGPTVTVAVTALDPGSTPVFELVPPPVVFADMPAYTLYEDSFEPVQFDRWMAADPTSRQWLDGYLRIIPGTPDFPGEYITVYEPLQDSRFVVRLRLESEVSPDPGNSVAGVVLRYRVGPEGLEYYVFGLDYQRQEWTFAYYRESGGQKTREVITSGALPDSVGDLGDQEVELAVLARGDSYALAINHEDVAQVQDSRLAPYGRFGVINDNRAQAGIAFAFDYLHLEVVGAAALGFAQLSPTPPPAEFQPTPPPALDDMIAALNALFEVLADETFSCPDYVAAYDQLEALYAEAASPEVQPWLAVVVSPEYGAWLDAECQRLGLPDDYSIDGRTSFAYWQTRAAIRDAVAALGGLR